MEQDAFFACEMMFDSEETVDRVMLAASDAYESTQEATPSSSAERKPDQPHLLLPPPPTTTTTPGPSAATATAPSTSTTPGPPSTAGRFAAPLTEGEIVEVRQAGIPEKTKRDTRYCLNTYTAWKTHTEKMSNTTITPLEKMSKQEIAHILTRFVLEVRKKDGSVYPANSLHHIIAGLQRHIRASGCQVDLFKEEVFGDFRSSLDAEMKRIQGLGVGMRVRRAEIITVD